MSKSEVKHKEFWLVGNTTGMSCYMDCEDEILDYDPVDACVHVIEYKAYQSLQKENEELKFQLADRSEKYKIAMDKGVDVLSYRLRQKEKENEELKAHIWKLIEELKENGNG